jgi:uncharacterized protein (TIGR02391 family)
MEIPQGPYRSLLLRYPTHDAWMAADSEDMAMLLLRDLAVGGQGISLFNIVGAMRDRYYQYWGIDATPARLNVLAEAYGWLKSVGLLVQHPTEQHFDIVSRRGRNMKEDGFAEFRAARRTGYEILDRRIAEKVWTIYLRGDYDIAIAYAFKVVEMRMREKGGFSTNDMGERLAKKFFARFSSEAPKKGERSLPSVVSLFIGALDGYRNPAVHEHPQIHDPEEAMEVLLLANHCLRIVERSTQEHESAGEVTA